LLISNTNPEDTEVKQLKTVSLPIGMMPDTKFSNQRCDIDVASTLYVFSDGIYEIMQPDGDIWGLDGFIDLLSDNRRAIADQGLNYVLNHVKTLSPNESLDDDLSLLRINFG